MEAINVMRMVHILLEAFPSVRIIVFANKFLVWRPMAIVAHGSFPIEYGIHVLPDVDARRGLCGARNCR